MLLPVFPNENSEKPLGPLLIVPLLTIALLAPCRWTAVPNEPVAPIAPLLVIVLPSPQKAIATPPPPADVIVPVLVKWLLVSRTTPVPLVPVLLPTVMTPEFWMVLPTPLAEMP